ncbi:barnase inhibitor [Cellulomonas terrae]|uniref:Barstar (barnase inhibitor) domain-containing protein n=1 Tax=Cellulomonas terrae TaxID=311234 RepID=A0A511JLV2_9CELL|nr:barnase inhibitor [Cellulomonas terrae]GEL99002.1 hypothetical protein CTE05_25490 [Cellulomonas terrae]
MSEPPDGRPVLVMDGSRFDDYAGFAREFTQFLDNYAWHGDLNALNDIMWGGFGTPQGSWTLRWTHSERSRAALGYEETARRLHELLPRVHSTGRAHWQERLDQARRHEGPTLFDEVVEIIRDHDVHGGESGDRVTLDLA